MSTQVPGDMKAFNREVIAEFRANQGKLSGQLAMSQVLLLTTTGVKSGQPPTVVVGYRMDGDRYVMIASGNGMADHPAWYKNLSANPDVTIEVGPTGSPHERAPRARTSATT